MQCRLIFIESIDGDKCICIAKCWKWEQGGSFDAVFMLEEVEKEWKERHLKIRDSGILKRPLKRTKGPLERTALWEGPLERTALWKGPLERILLHWSEPEAVGWGPFDPI